MGLGKKTIDDQNYCGKKVLVRCDFNVPMKDGVITNENRINAALPNLICILAAVLGSVAAYAVILLGMKNPLVLEYLEKAKQKFRKTS